MNLRLTLAIALVALGSHLAISQQQQDPLQLDPALQEYRASAKLSGSLSVSTYDNSDNVMARWLDAFHKMQPQVAVSAKTEPQATPQNTRSMASLAGQVQVIAMKRLPQPNEEAPFFGRTGYHMQKVKVGNCSFWQEDGAHVYGIIVNKSNPLKKLTLAQVDALFSKDRLLGYPEALTTWRQLGITTDIADKSIHVYGRDPSGDPAVDFSQLAMGGGSFADSYYTLPDLEIAAAAVAADPRGIAFTDPPNFDRTDVNRVAIETRDGTYSIGDVADIVSDVYPLSKHMYLFLNYEPGKPLDPIVKEFVRFVLSKNGQEALSKERFVPLNSKQVIEELAKLSQ